MQAESITLRRFLIQTAVLLLLLGIAFVPTVGRPIALVLLIIAECGNPEWTFKALIAGIIVVNVYPSIIGASGDIGSIVTVLKWLLLFVAFIRSLLSRVAHTSAYGHLVTCW